MSRITYLPDCVRKSDMKIIVQANPILEEYWRESHRVTLRQLFYQFVSRDFAPNSKGTYNRVCEAMKRGRMGGLVDWSRIEDRTRIVRSRPQWNDPAEILSACANQYHVDYWQDQIYRPEIWIEKDALLGIIENTCNRWDCSYFSCRGYPSTSELHEASLRFKRLAKGGQTPVILYCGDHDPSGLDMGTSIVKTLNDFGTPFEFKRIALNMDQIRRLNPPPNPVKESDTRTKAYRKLYGPECWELDALSPRELNRIVETEIIDRIDDMDALEDRRHEEQDGRSKLRIVADNFGEAFEYADLCNDDKVKRGGCDDEDDFEDDDDYEDDEDFDEDEFADDDEC